MMDQLFREFRDFWKDSNEPDKSPLRNNRLICPLVISNCNGTGDWPFSDATLEYSTLEGCTLSYWFMTALNYVHSELLKGGKKMNSAQRKSYDHLQKFVSEIDRHSKCLSLLCKEKIKTESEVCGILALHLFGPLVGEDYKIERGPGRCDKCCRCGKDIKTGDTTFGHRSVWHGKADIMLANSIVKVDTGNASTAENLESSPQETGLEETDEELDFNPDCSSRKIPSQVLAQTIVNAFCCVQTNKSLSNSFIPSFLANKFGVSISMYNCDRDKLLLSQTLPLWKDGTNADEWTLNINTILYIWMALHVDIFETEVTEGLQEHFPCCKFKDTVGCKIFDVYKKKSSRPMKSDTITIQSAPEEMFVVNPLLRIPATYIEEYEKMSKHLKKRFESSD